MIILNYEEHYENLIKNGFAKFTNHRDMLILAYEWKKQGFKKGCIKDMLIDFCEKWDKNFCEAKIESKINLILAEIDKPQRKIPTEVCFSRSEIDFIISIANYELQKVLFVIMTIAKLRKTNYIYINSSSNIKLKDIFELAQVNISTKKQELVFHELIQRKAIELNFSLKCEILCLEQNGSVAVAFAPRVGFIQNCDIVLGKVIVCQRCGVLVAKTNNKIKYCSECKRVIQREQQSEFMRKKRNVEK